MHWCSQCYIIPIAVDKNFSSPIKKDKYFATSKNSQNNFLLFFLAKRVKSKKF